MDDTHLSDTGSVQTLERADPQFQVGIHRILHQDRNIDPFQGIGQLLHGKRVGYGSRSDP